MGNANGKKDGVASSSARSKGGDPSVNSHQQSSFLRLDEQFSSWKLGSIPFSNLFDPQMMIAAIVPAWILATAGSNLAKEDKLIDFTPHCFMVVAIGFFNISDHYKQSDSSYMKSATSVAKLNDLGDRLKNNVPLVVKVTGKVVCSEAPIVVGLKHLLSDVESKAPTVTTFATSEFDSISCVIYEGETEIVYADRARNGGRFTSTMEFKSIRDEVPWYLEDDTGSVYIEGIQKAKGFDLVSRKREVAGPGTAFLRELDFVGEIDNRQGRKMLGVKHIECALEVDTALTVVGNAVKDDSGNITIQDPLFVCRSDVEDDAAQSTVFGQSSAWDFAGMAALVSSLLLFATMGLKNLAPHQVADDLRFLSQVLRP